MKIVIVGIGKTGEYLARLLAKEDNEITLIDKKFLGKESLIHSKNINYIEGNAIDSEILEEADVNYADLLICTMKRDEENITCALIGKELGVKNTIVRVRNREYSSSINTIHQSLGISMVINPDFSAAEKIALSLSVPNALDATTFLKGRINVISIKIKENSALKNTTIFQLSKKFKNHIIICAIERNGEIVIPTGDTEILENDKIHVIGTRKNINSFLTFAKLLKSRTKKVFIVGGSNIAVYLSKMLFDMGIAVKIVEDNNLRCKEISENIHGIDIICGDPSIQNLLYEEGIEDCDAFLALSSIDEKNIVYSMFASIVDVPKIITKINHINLNGVVEKANIDTVITPHKIVANQIVQYIRAVDKTDEGSCDAIYNFDDIFEMLEFKVRKDFKALDKKLSDIKLKNNILIGVIQRENKIIYPTGDDIIKLDDTVLIVSKEHKIKNLNEVLK